MQAWNSQLARRFVLAIPREIPPEQYADLIRDYCREFFVSKGMIADFAIHDKGDGNPHAHILFSILGKLEIIDDLRLIMLYLGSYLIFQIVIGIIIFKQLLKKYEQQTRPIQSTASKWVSLLPPLTAPFVFVVR